MSPWEWLQRQRDAIAAVWRTKLNRVSFRVPACGATADRHAAHGVGARVDQPRWASAATRRARLRAFLDSRWRPDLRGTCCDSGTRTWCVISCAGTPRISSHNGKVPCCVDARGADPVPENDSHGEFIFLVSELYRYTHDRALLEAMWPHVEAAADYMETLRQSERTAANLVARTACLLWLAAGVDQPRGLCGETDALVLGRFLGLEGVQRGSCHRHSARPSGGGDSPGAAA